MTALSDKYIAGFLDADGSVLIDKRGYLRVEFHQKQTNDGVIDRIHEVTGGSRLTRLGRRRGTRTVAARLVVTGTRAASMLNRLRKHLVVKAQRVENALAQIESREAVDVSPKVHPSRAWLAGYFDGDGMVNAYLNTSNGGAVRTSITTGHLETAGVELVHKAFGGKIRCRENTVRWELQLDAAKAKQFLGYFAKHSLIKREQIYFTLGCAAMGHFRDGKTIVATLKALKTHPHRLSDLVAGVDVTEYLSCVRDLPRKRGQWHDAGQACRHCGSQELYAKGLCSPCWRRHHYRLKRQSA